MAEKETCDVIVIGGGSAAFEAAVSARQSGAEKVVMVEKAPEAEYGGNARFSHTGFRFCHDGKDEIRAFIPDVDAELFAAMEIKPYTEEEFLGDLNRVTEGLIDEDLAAALTAESNAAAHWALATGIKWIPEKYATIACAGGFQANPEMRARYLGENADLLKVRGSKHDTGEVLAMIMGLGAKATGHWQGAHQTPIDAGAPRFETPVREDGRGNAMNRYDYCHGITVNSLGRRFFDEGESFHSYTYAKTGRAVRSQPGNIAYQIFDQKGIAMFRHGPDFPATFEQAGTIEELAAKAGLNPEIVAHTVTEYNHAVADDVPFDPSKLDGKCTTGITPPKSNWAQKIDAPPYRGTAPIRCRAVSPLPSAASPSTPRPRS